MRKLLVILFYTPERFTVVIALSGIGATNPLGSVPNWGSIMFGADTEAVAESAKIALEKAVAAIGLSPDLDLCQVSDRSLDFLPIASDPFWRGLERFSHLSKAEMAEIDWSDTGDTFPETPPDDHGTFDGFESEVYRDLWTSDGVRYGDN